MTLRTKFLLYAVLPLVAIQALLAFTDLRERRALLLRATRASMARFLKDAAAAIDAESREAVLVARTMSLAQEAGLFGRRAESAALCRRVLEERRDFVTAYVLYEANADGRDARDLAELGGRVFWIDGTGRFSAAYSRDPGEPDRIVEQRTPAAEMETALYYDGLRRRVAGGSGERTLVSEPYRYSDRVLMVEQTSAIMVGGRFAGITGVDRALDDLDARLRELRPFETARFYLLSSAGRVVAATLEQDVRTMRAADLRLGGNGEVVAGAYVEKGGMRELDEGRLAALVPAGARTDLAELLSGAKAGPGEPVVREVTDPFDGRRAFLASARVPTGGWTLVMTVSEKEVLAPIDRTIRRTLLFTGLGVAAVVFLIVFLARSLATRLGRAVVVARSVADGDLTVRIEDSAPDEPGRLLRAIGEMTTRLGSLVGKVGQATDRLAATADRMRASAHRQEGAVQDFSASTTEIATALRQVAATGEEVSGAVQGVRGVAAGVARLADEGRKDLSAMEAGLAQLSRSTATVSVRLGAIRERTEKITSMVSTIVAVADRTNLLSLNAAIEAEKAGAAGAGFAVVAQEIRRLADQTAIATLDIEKNVAEMQGAVAEGLVEMDQLSAEMARGSAGLGRLTRQMERALEEAESLHPKIASVTADVSAQAEGVGQITDGVGALAVAARQAAQEIQGFRHAEEELGRAVALLRDEVARFTVEAGPGTGGPPPTP